MHVFGCLCLLACAFSAPFAGAALLRLDQAQVLRLDRGFAVIAQGNLVYKIDRSKLNEKFAKQIERAMAGGPNVTLSIPTLAITEVRTQKDSK